MKRVGEEVERKMERRYQKYLLVYCSMHKSVYITVSAMKKRQVRTQ